MSTPIQVAVQPVRFEQADGFTIAGIGGRFSQSSISQIPQLWQRFEPHIGKVPGQVGEHTYGVCCNADANGNFDYIAGVQVEGVELLPAGFQGVELKPQRYAVFEHHGSLDNLKATFQAIWHDWLPQSGEQVAQAPEFERYGKDFDPFASHSVMEIWLPLDRKK
ncbi:AraC family transcriptional regulator [Pseudomonas alkylphenolica]|jgi:AraC family transcriptional regulator|uniref:AraC family transcriptional regulator n=1 Tax=Pseudomonas alkylphenolica TaxID=237609 RepID=A0A6I6HHX7_9PSED|nr:GyrI-like domain-containing protein [Pseudomonas alkylphenolica]QGW78817.1 AraC family transcriptional regulator [Pseudomonas alkylphenolica]